MMIYRLSFRTIVLAGSLLVLTPTTVVVLAQQSYPLIIASLFPKNASISDGQYFPGDSGMGRGSADLPFSFEDPSCVKTNYSSCIGLEVSFFGGEAAALIKSKESPFGPIDRDVDKERFITDATNELARTDLAPKRETLGIGEIVYVEFESMCPPVGQATAAARLGPTIVPNVKLKGVAWTDNASLQVTLDGPTSVELAKAAVAEMFANLQKADFSKAE
jgi:hypothetical protein